QNSHLGRRTQQNNGDAIKTVWKVLFFLRFLRDTQWKVTRTHTHTHTHAHTHTHRPEVAPIGPKSLCLSVVFLQGGGSATDPYLEWQGGLMLAHLEWRFS